MQLIDLPLIKCGLFGHYYCQFLNMIVKNCLERGELI